MQSIRETLLQCYLAGIASVRGNDAVQRYLRQHPLGASLHLVAIGKAAVDMTLGAITVCDDLIHDGLVITKHGHLGSVLAGDHRFSCIESDHPVPGENTLCAGTELLHYLKNRAKAGARFLFLLSGGASSLVDVLPDNMSLNDLRALNRSLLSSGLNIEQMNRARCSLSQIKSGRLAEYLRNCPTLNLLVSDVPDDNPAVIGSGLLTYSDDAVDISIYPQTVRELLYRHRCTELTDLRHFSRITTRVVACIDDAKAAAAAAARTQGFPAEPMSPLLVGDAEKAGVRLAGVLRSHSNLLHVWGGETTVTLPEHPGCGGRNQHLALSAAIALQGTDGIYLLAAGTDGTDGPTTAAGGLVDGATVRRGEAMGLYAGDCLRRADAGTFLKASGDLVETGPTGTNVMDLVLGFNDRPR